ncbi:MAG: transglutaminase domain-containing protein [Verrucomicrobia bacterium]|nr:transglutaminase domain-containing protein [Verrucomicrobiota bacterium]
MLQRSINTYARQDDQNGNRNLVIGPVMKLRRENNIGARAKTWARPTARLRSVIAALLLGLGIWANVEAASQPNSLRAYAEKIQRRQAYGVYLKNHKFGWAVDELKLGHHEGKEVATCTFEMEGSFLSAGEKSSFEEKSVIHYSLEGEGQIVAANERTVEDGAETIRTVVGDGNGLVITTRTKAGEINRRVPVPKDTLERVRQLDQWLTSTPTKGAQFVGYSTFWDQEEVDGEEVHIYRGRKIILWGGVKTPVHQVSVNMDGMVMDCEMMSDGTPIKGLMGGLFELRAEKESIAKMPGAEPIDMLEASSIRVDKDLGAPDRVEALTLRIVGLNDFRIPASHRQRVRSRQGSAVILELMRDHKAPQSTPLPASKREEYLRATPTLQSDQESIRNKAQEIIGGEKDTLEKARLLQEWVFRNVRQTMAANTTSALDVLSNRAGDCTEITMLFVALARSLGIPAREVGGVMYANEGTPIFGWHAWAEIHDGHQWVTVDPTWNQVYVDATHINLAEDSKDWAWVNLLGKMKIKVLKVTKRK